MPRTDRLYPHETNHRYIRPAANIIHDADICSRKVLILGLDIHKAFYSILWPYIDAVLNKFGFLGEFVNGFKALYHNPHTRIKLPGCSLEYFPLSRGTRQGCPLSPLIFALAIEPLARAIINNLNIKGYTKGRRNSNWVPMQTTCSCSCQTR